MRGLYYRFSQGLRHEIMMVLVEIFISHPLVIPIVRIAVSLEPLKRHLKAEPQEM